VGDKDRYKRDIDLDRILYGIIEMYAKIQGVSFASIVRQALADKFFNEIQNIQPTYKPKMVKERKK